MSNPLKGADRVCATGKSGKGYCGRKNRQVTPDWSKVVCVDCEAAKRADEAAS